MTSGSEEIFTVIGPLAWSAVAAVLLLFVCTLTLHHYVLPDPATRERSLLQRCSISLWRLLGLATGQTQRRLEDPHSLLAQRTTLAVSGLFVVLLLSLFTSSLLSLILAERVLIPFHDSRQLAALVRLSLSPQSQSHPLSASVGGEGRASHHAAEQQLLLHPTPGQQQPHRNGQATPALLLRDSRMRLKAVVDLETAQRPAGSESTHQG